MLLIGLNVNVVWMCCIEWQTTFIFSENIIASFGVFSCRSTAMFRCHVLCCSHQGKASTPTVKQTHSDCLPGPCSYGANGEEQENEGPKMNYKRSKLYALKLAFFINPNPPKQ